MSLFAKERRKRVVRILSVDGGGMRGIIPALVLRHLEDRLEERGIRRRLHEVFDLMAGTSTGGLIVAALAAPARDPHHPDRFLRSPAIAVGRILEIYLEWGPQIFPRRVFDRLRAVRQAVHERYSSEPLRRLLRESFGDATLKDALCQLLVPAYDMENGTAFFFKHRPERRDRTETDPNYYLRDVALATSAAPTYFEAVPLSPIGDPRTHRCLVDGGVFASNPGLAAYIEARKTFPDAAKYVILSLGTGIVTRCYPCAQMKEWGYLEWISPGRGAPLYGVMTRGQSESVDYQLRKVPDVDYIRIDGVLEDRHTEMDDASPENMLSLQDVAERVISTHQKSLDRFCDEL
jgi:patatin-like phospholipase/acyl hydrolase